MISHPDFMRALREGKPVDVCTAFQESRRCGLPLFPLPADAAEGVTLPVPWRVYEAECERGHGVTWPQGRTVEDCEARDSARKRDGRAGSERERQRTSSELLAGM